jgi:hypothetical protein
MYSPGEMRRLDLAKTLPLSCHHFYFAFDKGKLKSSCIGYQHPRANSAMGEGEPNLELF